MANITNHQIGYELVLSSIIANKWEARPRKVARPPVLTSAPDIACPPRDGVRRRTPHGPSETARPNSALIRDRIDAHGNHPCSKSTRGQPHGRLDRRDSQNFGWRSTCGSLGMEQFFLLESVTATFVATRSTIWPVPPTADYELSRRVMVLSSDLTFYLLHI